MKTRNLHKLIGYAVTGLLLTVVASTAQAAKFGVRIVTPEGEPIAGAAVCIGTHGDYKKFGATFTSSDGRVLLDVPPVPLVVTVSKNRFAGLRISEPARHFNLVKVIELRDGLPGPRCKAGSSLADSGSGSGTSPSIKGVSVKDNAVRVQLVPKVAGGASHYRLSSKRNMEKMSWLNLPDAIPVDTNLLGKTVYLQVARIARSGQSTIESHSNVYPVNLKSL